jgi:hypothetical protein
LVCVELAVETPECETADVEVPAVVAAVDAVAVCDWEVEVEELLELLESNASVIVSLMPINCSRLLMLMSWFTYSFGSEVAVGS